MIENKSISVENLHVLAEYFLQNRNNIEKVFEDFGEVSDNNGYGTFFLKPKNSLFKVFWVHQENNNIKAVGFGGEHLGPTLKELYSFYHEYTKNYSRYDEGYIYIFSSTRYINHAVRIFSKKEIMDRKNILHNIDINGIDIILR